MIPEIVFVKAKAENVDPRLSPDLFYAGAVALRVNKEQFIDIQERCKALEFPWAKRIVVGKLPHELMREKQHKSLWSDHVVVKVSLRVLGAEPGLKIVAYTVTPVLDYSNIRWEG